MLVYPLLVVRRLEHGARREAQRHAPFVIPARLTANGDLLAGGEHPLIPRELLQPTDTLDAPVIGDIAAYDDFCSRGDPPAERGDWEGVVSMVRTLWERLTETAFERLEAHPVLADFVVLETGLVALDVDRGGASASLIQLYDLLREEGDPARTAPLLAAFSRPERSTPEVIRPGEYETRHLAQMSGEFPLSPSQRMAVVAQQRLPEHETLVINGPPGTGKTTLIQSMVATEMASRVLADDEPPLFLVASNNNQAVTNVLEAMRGAGVPPAGHALSDSALAARWVDGPDAFGLYLASKSKAKDAERRSFPFTTNLPFREGSPGEWESEEFIDRAAARVLDRAQGWRNESPTGNTTIARLQTVQSWLRNELEAVASRLDDLHAAWETLSGICDQQHGATLVQLEDAWTSIRSELSERAADRDRLDEQRQELRKTLDEQRERELGLWERIEPQGLAERLWPLNRLSSIRRRWRHRVLRALAEAAVQTDWTPASGFDHPAVESLLASWSKQRRAELDGRQAGLETERRRLDGEIERLMKVEAAGRQEIERRREAEREWRERAERLAVGQTQIEEPDWDHVDGQGIHRRLDTHWRFLAFLLAARYWETDWVRLQLEMREQGRRRDRQDRTSSLARLRRMARLTPVMVGTFHTLPRQISCFDGSRKQAVPLWSAAD
ncbi:MAG: AAA domain-containing protein, partial [Pseudomonadota bacterium]